MENGYLIVWMQCINDKQKARIALHTNVSLVEDFIKKNNFTAIETSIELREVPRALFLKIQEADGLLLSQYDADKLLSDNTLPRVIPTQQLEVEHAAA